LLSVPLSPPELDADETDQVAYGRAGQSGGGAFLVAITWHDVLVVELKTSAEIEAMRPAGQVVATALAQMRKHAAVGVSTLELDEIARAVLAEHGASSPFLHYQPSFAHTPFPAVICASVNDAALHGIPSGYRLADGDLLSIDFGATLHGWTGDAAVSFTVGTPRPADLRLIDAAERALAGGIASALVGGRLGDISAAIGGVARAAGYGLHTDFGGHGVGHTMHESPSVPNDGRAGRGLKLPAGLVIAIEPWFMAGGEDSYLVDPDGWTLRSGDGSRAAHVEHTIAITAAGPQILTAL
jgi:methionyl aminopeptidase